VAESQKREATLLAQLDEVEGADLRVITASVNIRKGAKTLEA